MLILRRCAQARADSSVPERIPKDAGPWPSGHVLRLVPEWWRGAPVLGHTTTTRISGTCGQVPSPVPERRGEYAFLARPGPPGLGARVYLGPRRGRGNTVEPLTPGTITGNHNIYSSARIKKAYFKERRFLRNSCDGGQLRTGLPCFPPGIWPIIICKSATGRERRRPDLRAFRLESRGRPARLVEDIDLRASADRRSGPGPDQDPSVGAAASKSRIAAPHVRKGYPLAGDLRVMPYLRSRCEESSHEPSLSRHRSSAV